MAVNPSYRDFVLEQLGRVAPDIRGKAMFGGLGIYSGDYFFALIGGNTLYLKVDATNRVDFVDAGMGPFMPFGEGGEVMQYFELPADVLEDPDQLGLWVTKAVDVARKARLARKPAAKKPDEKSPAPKKPSPRKGK